MFETTYAAYFRMVYQSTYDAILATPVDAESLAFAEILWAITHAVFDTLIIMVVLAVFGAATSPWAILAPLPLLVGAVFMAGLSLGITAHVHDIDAFNIYMAMFFSLMYISGAWFPIDVLPVWLQIPAWVMPSDRINRSDAGVFDRPLSLATRVRSGLSGNICGRGLRVGEREWWLKGRGRRSGIRGQKESGDDIK